MLLLTNIRYPIIIPLPKPTEAEGENVLGAIIIISLVGLACSIHI